MTTILLFSPLFLYSGKNLWVDFPRMLNNNSGSTVALVDVLLQIYDRSGEVAPLATDESAILCCQIWVMRNDPTVVDLEISWAIDPDRLSIDPFVVFSGKGLG